jgi:hypothetical protein
VRRTLAWDEAANGLTNVTTHTGADTTSPVAVQNDNFFYDAMNNITRIVDQTTIIDGVPKPQTEAANASSPR